MLAVSFIGKKFCCDAQVEVANDIENGGLQLNLKVRETCGQFIKTPEPVLATLHVSLNNGRREDVSKCKELLTFLKEQVLPKTVKLISLKRIKKVKDEDNSDGGTLFGCIWPGKTKKRKEENKNRCIRGYSSDTDSYPQKSVFRSSIKLDSPNMPQTSTAGILATPSVTRANLSRVEKVTSRGNILEEEDTLFIAKLKNTSDEKISLNHPNESHLDKTENGDVNTLYNNLTTSFATKERSKIVKCNTTSCFGIKRSRKLGTGKCHVSERGPQRVQNVKPDTPSKNTAIPGMIAENNLDKQTKHDLEQFAAQYVGRICELALSRKVKESCKDFAKVYVDNVLTLAWNRIADLENLKHNERRVRCEEKCSLEVEDHPSFSKVWKYSQALAEGHDFSEAWTTIKDTTVNGEELGSSSELLQSNDADITNDCQTEDFERDIMKSALSSNDSLSETSPSSASESMEFYTHRTQERGKPIPPCKIENEAIVDYARKNAEGGKMENENFAFFTQAVEEDGNYPLDEAIFEENGALGISSKPHKEGGELPPGKTGHGKLVIRLQRTDNQLEPNCSRRQPCYKRSVSESQASERKQWNSSQPGDDDIQAKNNLSPTCRPDNTPPKFVRSISCPDVTEDDVFIESILSHHGDVYDSLAQRTWTILHVHELWNGGKPMDAMKACIELTGMVDFEKSLGTTPKLSAPCTLMSRDHALFLNILQQLPSSWWGK